MSDRVKLIYGVPFGSSISGQYRDVLDEFHIKDLDTGSSYPGSEEGIGETSIASQYLIHSKTKGYRTGTQDYSGVIESAAESIRRLRIESLETYYLHTPDPTTSITEALDAIQKVYEEGKFKHFGLSNFLPDDIQTIYDYCSSKGYVLPSVYQGHYNPVGRHAEVFLFPLLRKLNMSFCAYAALAGGFLTKSPEFIAESKATRWDRSTRLGQLYHTLYNKPKLLDALKTWEEISRESGIPKAALSYRWVTYNSSLRAERGDGVVLGASSPEQLRLSLEYLEDGPLEKEVADRIDEVWNSVKDEAVLDNFNTELKW